MTRSSNQQVVFRDYPVSSWVVGAIVLAACTTQVVSEKAGWGTLKAAVIMLVGLVIAGFGSVLTVALDFDQRMLDLRYRSLFRSSQSLYSIDEISIVRVKEIMDSNRMYRLELILRTGEIIPLRWGYSSGGTWPRRAKQLRSALSMDPG
jgi:hypothetical protein